MISLVVLLISAYCAAGAVTRLALSTMIAQPDDPSSCPGSWTSTHQIIGATLWPIILVRAAYSHEGNAGPFRSFADQLDRSFPK